MRRVVVTGCGLVSAMGTSVPSAFEFLKARRNAVVSSAELAGYKGLQTTLCAPAQTFEKPAHYTRKVLRSMGPVSVMALYAAEQALAQAGLADDPVLRQGRAGVAYGSSSGSVGAISDFYSMLRDRVVKNVTSSTYLKMMPQTAAVNLSVHFGTTGRLIPTGTACTSGSLAVGYAYETIKHGLQDIMIAGGAEEFSPTQVAVFDTLFATSRMNGTPSLTPRPFDRRRDGLVVGEGAGALILEERGRALARGAEILAEVAGFGSNTDGCHVTQPNRRTMARAMELALQDARIPPGAVGYVNAHGTATERGDIAEGQATLSVYGPRVPVGTLKSYIGHTLGACGAIEAILSIEMMRRDWYAPNLNLDEPDERCGPLDFIRGDGRFFPSAFIASNNFAFGGVNTSLIFKRT